MTGTENIREAALFWERGPGHRPRPGAGRTHLLRRTQAVIG
jgi:hypothetical protein